MAAQICETCKHKKDRCYCSPNSTCSKYEEEQREKSELEVRKEFIEMIKHMIEVWSNIEGDYDRKYLLNSLTCSFLSLLDGCSNMPKFIVAPDPHPEDKKYHIENNDKYYPENHSSNIKCDISGCLQEMFLMSK